MEPINRLLDFIERNLVNDLESWHIYTPNYDDEAVIAEYKFEIVLYIKGGMKIKRPDEFSDIMLPFFQSRRIKRKIKKINSQKKELLLKRKLENFCNVVDERYPLKISGEFNPRLSKVQIKEKFDELFQDNKYNLKISDDSRFWVSLENEELYTFAKLKLKDHNVQFWKVYSDVQKIPLK